MTIHLPPPIEPLRCRNPDCTLPDGGVCARSEQHARPQLTCPELVRVTSQVRVPKDTTATASSRAPVTPSDPPPTVARAPQPAASSRDPASAAPWSGRHLSEAEADRLMWSSPARVLGIVGPSSAGKTCLLTSLFLLLADGQYGGLPYRFAASRSLYALQTLGQELARWDGGDSPMLSRTPHSEGHDLGAFLHLGLRPRNPADDRLVDLLLCDIAGEHFSGLASLADGDMRARMAFLARCDGFVFVVDAHGLFGDRGRRLDAELARMFGRLVDLLTEPGRDRAPIAVVASKVDSVPEFPRPAPDGAPSPELRDLLAVRAPRLAASLRRAEAALIPFALFPVSAIPAGGQPLGVQAPFRYLLEVADRRAAWPRWQVPIRLRPRDLVPSFMAFRSWRDDR